jgi:hypothetical protein
MFGDVSSRPLQKLETDQTSQSLPAGGGVFMATLYHTSATPLGKPTTMRFAFLMHSHENYLKLKILHALVRGALTMQLWARLGPLIADPGLFQAQIGSSLLVLSSRF